MVPRLPSRLTINASSSSRSSLTAPRANTDFGVNADGRDDAKSGVAGADACKPLPVLPIRDNGCGCGCEKGRLLDAGDAGTADEKAETKEEEDVEESPLAREASADRSPAAADATPARLDDATDAAV